MRILLDVNILVRANEHSQGPARTLLLKLIEQNHTLLMSREMLMELAAVLRYPRLQALYGLNEEKILNYVQFLQHASELIDLTYARHAPIRDPNDIAVLQTAVIGEADIICTLDSDFYSPETLVFCGMLGIEICSDVELIAKID